MPPTGAERKVPARQPRDELIRKGLAEASTGEKRTHTLRSQWPGSKHTDFWNQLISHCKTTGGAGRQFMRE